MRNTTSVQFNRLFLIPQLSLLLFATSLYAKYPLLIYYGATYDVKYFERYHTVVLDPDLYPDVHALNSRSFAYLSIGEVSSGRCYYKTLEEKGLLEGKNRDWGSHHIRIVDKEWEKMLLDEVIPPIVEGGYDGLFLDTVDSLIARNIPRAHIVRLIKSIKKRYPNLKLMLNRGFEIADMVPIDALLYESTITGYNFKNKKSYFFSYDFQFVPKRKIERFSVDYWDQKESEKIGEIYKIALSRGYKPLVTDITLNELPKVRWETSKRCIEIDR